MKLLLSLIALFLLNHSSIAAFFTNSTSADSFVRVAAPTLNYGGAGALAVSGTNAFNGSGLTNGAFDSFLRFDTAAMVTNFNGLFGSNNWVISGAKLRVTELGAPANAIFNRGRGAFEIRWTAQDNWLEGTGTPNAPATIGITYNDEVSLLEQRTDERLGTFTNGGVDATLTFPLALPCGFLKDLRAGGAVGLYLTAVDSGVGFTFDSRSFGPVSARPFLEVSAVPTPGIGAIHLTESDVILTGTNGATGGIYRVLSSSNAALPLSQWTPIATNVMANPGSFVIRLVNAVGPKSTAQYFVLQTQ